MIAEKIETVEFAVFMLLLGFSVAIYGKTWDISQDAASAFMEGERIQASKVIALTFDDGPHEKYTEELLDGLREREVHVTFFLIGNNIDGKENLVKRMQEDGHLIGNHTDSHVQLTKRNEKEACAEIERTNNKISAITGEKPSYIRPPYGSWSDKLECLVPMTVVLWDIDPLDWKIPDKRRVAQKVISQAEDGKIILLHDVYESSVQAAFDIIDTLRREGYTFVTVDEIMVE